MTKKVVRNGNSPLQKELIRDTLKESRVQEVFCKWFVVAKAQLDALYYSTSVMLRRIEDDPDCHLAKIVTAKDIQRLYSILDIASSRICDISPPLRFPLPDPIAAMDEE